MDTESRRLSSCLTAKAPPIHGTAGLAPQQLLLIDFDDLGPMTNPLGLPIVTDRAGGTPGSTLPADCSQ
jgi:hypothetical protein